MRALKNTTSDQTIIDMACRAIKIESEAVAGLAKRIDDTFVKIVHHIDKCQHLVITGMGKSGIIGKKIASTFASLGLPTLFIHAAEASHGDLGMIVKNDTVIAISNSGETEEVLKLLPSFKRINCTLVALTGKPKSTLAKCSDFVLNAGVEEEACSIDLVPTASTTATLALGDALAVALQHKKKFNLKLFKTLHPAGQLGKMLTTVKDLMFTKNAIPLIIENQNMEKAITLMSKKKLGCLVVKNKKNLVTGFISDGDLRRKSKNNFAEKKVKDIMTKSPIFVGENLLAVKAINIMNKKKITTLLVGADKDVNKKVKKIKIKGILHIHTLLKKGIN